MLLEIIHEDADLLAVNKPAGLVCHPTKGDELSSLISRARLHCGAGSTVHLVNRLDRETSGVVLLAKNAAAAGALGKIWEQRGVFKEYLAIVHGQPDPASATIELPLGKDESSAVAVKDCVRSDGASASTHYEVIRSFQRGGLPFSLLRVFPRSGRKHQIRIHLAHSGHPIVGDKLYGGDEDAYLALVEDRLTDAQKAALLLPNQALHGLSVRFTWQGKEHFFRAEPDATFREFCGMTSNEY